MPSSSTRPSPTASASSRWSAREQGEAIGRLAQQNGVTLTAVPNVSGTIEEILPRLHVDLDELEGQLRRIHGVLDSLSETWYGTVATIEEALAIEARKLDVYTKLGTQANTFVLEGWVPKRSRAQLESAIERASAGRACALRRPDHRGAADAAWTTRRGSATSSSSSGSTRSRSPPSGTRRGSSRSPSRSSSASCSGDWGYGLDDPRLISLWMIYGFPGRPAPPEGDRATSSRCIMGPTAMQQLASRSSPAASSPSPSACSPTRSSASRSSRRSATRGSSYQAHVAILLGVAVIFGVVMVTLGFGLGALHEHYRHHDRAALGKVGGIVAAVGVFGIFAPILSAGTGIFPTGTIATYGFVGAILAGVVLLIFGEGIQMGAIGALEVISHVLSYARLVGILLASAVLAFLINYFARGFLTSSGPSSSS